jgi:hypothetical protein
MRSDGGRDGVSERPQEMRPVRLDDGRVVLVLESRLILPNVAELDGSLKRREHERDEGGQEEQREVGESRCEQHESDPALSARCLFDRRGG